MKRAGIFGVILAAALAAATAGCAALHNEDYGAAVRARGKILFVPLREKAAYYYDSDAGVEIAARAGQAVLQKADNLMPVDFEKVRGPVRAHIMDETMSDSAWAQIGGAAGADWVVYGSIDRLDWFDQAENMPRASFAMSYTVFDVREGKPVYCASAAGRYPFTPYSDRGTTVYEMGEEGLRTRSYLYMAQVIARTFYMYSLAPTERASFAGKGYRPN